MKRIFQRICMQQLVSRNNSSKSRMASLIQAANASSRQETKFILALLFFHFTSTECALQLLRSELQPPSAWRRRLSDSRPRLRLLSPVKT